MFVKHLCFSVITWLCTASAWGTVTIYENQTGWEDAVNNDFDTITFAEFNFPPWTLITNQYQDQGVLFIDGVDRIYYNNGFLNDGVGLYGAPDNIAIEFAQPIHWIGYDYPGSTRMQLWLNGVLFYTTPVDSFPSSGIGFFAGLISTQPFDKVRIYPDLGGGAVFIDDLYFQSPIPAPSALAFFGTAPFLTRRRRRS